TMVLWNLDRYECKEQWLSGKFGQQICVAADWENQRAVSGTAQGKLLLWDSKKLALISAVDAHPGARINKVFIDVVIGFAVTAAEDGRLR
ncbi:HET-E1, partial [Symbiodinium sp. CCMP2456]